MRQGLVCRFLLGTTVALGLAGCVTAPSQPPRPEASAQDELTRLLTEAPLQSRRGDHEAASRSYGKALSLARAIEDPRLRRDALSRCYGARGDSLTSRGLLESARLDYQRALTGTAGEARTQLLARLVLAAELTGRSEEADEMRTLLGPSGEPVVSTLRRTLFQRGQVAEPPGPAIVSDAGELAVILHGRAEWKAAPLRTDRADPMTSAYRITVHHSGIEEPSRLAADETARIIRNIQADHLRRGWADIGYHYLVDTSGRVWEGRPREWQGAHAGNSTLNAGNIGISLLGNFEVQKVTEAQKRSLATLLALLCKMHGIDAGHIYTHRELHGTLCPGAHLQTFVDELRHRMRVSGLAAASSPHSPLPLNLSAPVRYQGESGQP
ncbi:MAG: peptidoglycan recognition family protein [Planctomycetota bacterium]